MKENLTKNQIRVLNLFRKDPFARFSIMQIAKSLKSKSYQRVYEAVKLLEKNKMLKLEQLGNTILVSLDLSRNTIINLAFIDEKEAVNKIPNYDKIINLKEISDYLIIITGSYANSSENKKSDLDLIIVAPNDSDIVNLQGIIENLTMLFDPKIHLYVFRKKDFIEMLLEKKENYGKEIFKNHLILKNAQQYYEILKEVIENGFKG